MNNVSGKAASRPRVAVAMSGGVDSSVTAALLVEQGYDVLGLTLRLFDEHSREEIRCVKQDVADAQAVAKKIGIEHKVLDCENRFFSEVVEYFADSYLRGETPVPCAVCNRNIKFNDLINAAREAGAKFLATGHYVRRIAGAHGAELHCGAIKSRDQSYFLFSTTMEQLDFLRFPLGDISKAETRALAEKFNLSVSSKPDSQDICFVPNGDYAAIVNKLRPGKIIAGEIVDLDGKILGQHDGIINFTVGQRRGLNIGNRNGDNNEPLYVISTEPDTGRVYVGGREALAKTEVFLREINWLGDEVPEEGIKVSVKLRSTQPPTPARFFPMQGGKGRIVFQEAVYGVAQGQAGVVYDGSRMLGGGWIMAEAPPSHLQAFAPKA